MSLPQRRVRDIDDPFDNGPQEEEDKDDEKPADDQHDDDDEEMADVSSDGDEGRIVRGDAVSDDDADDFINAVEGKKSKKQKKKAAEGNTAADILKGDTSDDDDDAGGGDGADAAALLLRSKIDNDVSPIWVAKIKLLSLLKKPNDSVVSLLCATTTDKAAKEALTEAVNQIDMRAVAGETYSAGMTTNAQRSKQQQQPIVEEKPVQNLTRCELMCQVVAGIESGSFSLPSTSKQQFLLVWSDSAPVMPRDAAKIQGPVSGADMNKWFRSGFFEQRAAFYLAGGSSSWTATPRTKMEGQTSFVSE